MFVFPQKHWSGFSKNKSLIKIKLWKTENALYHFRVNVTRWKNNREFGGK